MLATKTTLTLTSAPRKLSPGEAACDGMSTGGVVKWFDFEIGHGFVMLDNGMDALVHHRKTDHGKATYPVNTRVKCKVRSRPTGLFVEWMRPTDSNPAEQPWQQARVHWFNRTEGYGFVALESGEHAFLHKLTLRRCGFLALPRMGELVRVQLIKRKGARMAVSNIERAA
jgi:cold shock CspA family protein